MVSVLTAIFLLAIWQLNVDMIKAGCGMGQMSAGTRNDGTDICYSCSAGKYSGLFDDACINCAAGTYSSGTGWTYCNSCPAGKFAADSGQSECDPCPPGTYGIESGATTCYKCEPGSYNPESGQTRCSRCPEGTANWRSQSKYASDCETCPPGTFSPAGSDKCTSCHQGTYSTSPGSSECYLCPAGTAGSRAGARYESDCEPCRSGFFSSMSGSTSCTICAAGTYAENVASISCTACEPGKASGAVGSTSRNNCQTCKKGEYSKSGSKDCHLCPGGTFGIEEGAGYCEECPPGRASAVLGSVSDTVCEICAQGQYSIKGSSYCSDCEPGKFGNIVEAATCTDCAPGKASIATAAISEEVCTVCPAGSFAGGGFSKCELCKMGYYSTEPQSKKCTSCPPGSIGNEMGATSDKVCKSCHGGSYSDHSTCINCPAGRFGKEVAVTSLQECEKCPKGSYSTVVGAKHNECVPCDLGTYQDYAGETSCRSCPAGKYGGAIGATSSYECKLCAENSMSTESSAECITCYKIVAWAPMGSERCFIHWSNIYFIIIMIAIIGVRNDEFIYNVLIQCTLFVGCISKFWTITSALEINGYSFFPRFVLALFGLPPFIINTMFLHGTFYPNIHDILFIVFLINDQIVKKKLKRE